MTARTDPGPEYDRLVAERARLIADGVSPNDLIVPLQPEGLQPDGTLVYIERDVVSWSAAAACREERPWS